MCIVLRPMQWYYGDSSYYAVVFLVRQVPLSVEVSRRKQTWETFSGRTQGDEPKGTDRAQTLIFADFRWFLQILSPTQEPPPSPFRQFTRTMVWVLPGRKLGPWSEFPFLYRFTVLLNSGGSNSLWSEFWSEFPHFMGMGVVLAPSILAFAQKTKHSLSIKISYFGIWAFFWNLD